MMVLFAFMLIIRSRKSTNCFGISTAESKRVPQGMRLEPCIKYIGPGVALLPGPKSACYLGPWGAKPAGGDPGCLEVSSRKVRTPE